MTWDVTAMTGEAPTAKSDPAGSPDWGDTRAAWDLDPEVAHLNHGSFGAVPRTVRAAQARWRDLSDANPMNYYREIRIPAVQAARVRAAAFLGAAPDSLGLVGNATAGVSTVLASFPLGPDDEVILTDHSYGAVTLAAHRWARSAGARVVTAPVDLLASDEEVTSAVLAAFTSRTRLLIIDHITSQTARLFPVAALAAAATERGVATLVDGAHVPGMLPVQVERLGADFWVGNFHKWAFAPRGVAGLWIAQPWRDRIRPLVASWSEEHEFPAAFDQQGTADDSAWLAVPDALDFFTAWQPQRLRDHNNALAAYGQQVVGAALGVAPEAGGGAPELSMRIIPLPAGVATDQEGAHALSGRIAKDLRIEVAVTCWRERGFVRVSAQAYNAAEEYERLATGLAHLLG
ncbi:aminotransferase class V-fold PLP-dependent enzyme [Actinopolymorpha sp. NPDC004070]|uniref:aminotransferase class V-fold PLP-dependent enzyme n=1 Tax=Actinopolymorpha sp. NPDC004070 TaxID=3154548 RepID=UPI0033A25A2C